MKRSTELTHEQIQLVVAEGLADLGLALSGIKSAEIQINDQHYLVTDGVASLKPPRSEEEIRQALNSLGNQLNEIMDGRLEINGATYLIYGEKTVADQVQLLLLDAHGAEFTYTLDGEQARRMISEGSAVIQGQTHPQPYPQYPEGSDLTCAN